MTLEHLYADSGTIKAPSTTVSETGYVKETFATVASSVACDIQPVTQGFLLKAEGYLKKATHRGFFELGTDIRRGYRFEQNSSFEPTIFDVVEVKEIRAHHLEVLLQEYHEPDGTGGSGVS